MECELRGMSAKLLGAWLAGKYTGMFTKHDVDLVCKRQYAIQNLSKEQFNNSASVFNASKFNMVIYLYHDIVFAILIFTYVDASVIR
jgi:hypothetical protein